MAAYRIYPHRTAPQDAADVQWWVETDGHRVICPDVLEGWDYDASLTIGMTLDIDADRVLAGTGLEHLSLVAGVLQVECKRAQTRFIGQARFGDPQEPGRVDVSLTMPPGSVSSDLTLNAYLVLAEARDPRLGGRVASRKGSRLLRLPPHTLLLEGDAGRFPTEAVSFKQLGLRSAPWTVSLNHEDMGDSFMGTVRLLINADHEVAQALQGEEAPRFAALMQADLIRLLVARLSHEEIEPDHLDNEDSLANVMDTMCALYLNCTFDEATNLFKRDPVAFEALVQQEINPLQRLLS